MNVLSISVDISVSLKEDIYYVKYKDCLFKYFKSDNVMQTDSLLGFFKDREHKNHVYKMMTEFLRAFAYFNNFDIRMSRGLEGHNHYDISKIEQLNIIYSERKEVPCRSGNFPGFVYLSKIDSKEKADLLRLYTEARTNSNIYFQILFYWHAISYPNKQDKESGINLINEYLQKNNEYCDRYKHDLNNNDSFGAFKHGDIGKYIYENIRNSVAHICRSGEDFVNINVDDIKQEVILYSTKDLLEHVAKDKLDNIFKLNINASKDICSYYDPNTITQRDLLHI